VTKLTRFSPPFSEGEADNKLRSSSGRKKASSSLVYEHSYQPPILTVELSVSDNQEPIDSSCCQCPIQLGYC